MAVGPSPPREVRNGKQAKRDTSTEISPPRDSNKTMRVSPFRDSKEIPTTVKRHSISVGPSPPRENSPRNNVITPNVQKKSTGTSPPRDVTNQRPSSSATSKTNVSNTGTSPPPQSISTQVKLYGTGIMFTKNNKNWPLHPFVLIHRKYSLFVIRDLGICSDY